MKSALFAAALLCGGAALAQDDTTTTTTTTDDRRPQVPTGQVVAPSNANPERDARGIPVISDAAVVAAGLQPAGRHERRRRPDGRSVAAAGAAAGDAELSALLADRHRPLRPDLRARRPPAALSRAFRPALIP